MAATLRVETQTAGFESKVIEVWYCGHRYQKDPAVFTGLSIHEINILDWKLIAPPVVKSDGVQWWFVKS